MLHFQLKIPLEHILKLLNLATTKKHCSYAKLIHQKSPEPKILQRTSSNHCDTASCAAIELTNAILPYRKLCTRPFSIVLAITELAETVKCRAMKSQSAEYACSLCCHSHCSSARPALFLQRYYYCLMINYSNFNAPSKCYCKTGPTTAQEHGLWEWLKCHFSHSHPR